MNAPEILEDFESSEALWVADACDVMDEDFSNEITINNIPQLIGDTFKRLEVIKQKRKQKRLKKRLKQRVKNAQGVCLTNQQLRACKMQVMQWQKRKQVPLSCKR